MTRLVAVAALLLAPGIAPADDPMLPPADVYVIGERHDNPGHHATQARLVTQVRPSAVVFEMLTPGQAARILLDTPRDAATLGPLLDWAESGWPDIAWYAPIMAATDAPILGAAGDGDDLSGYGLDEPLPAGEQTTREALQSAAHCDALPFEALPRFVARQREADARFAARTLAALDAHGSPVVLIAGNGHARIDWGVPAAIARVRPGVRVVAVVQGEGGADDVPPGDVSLTSRPVERGDPCMAFR